MSSQSLAIWECWEARDATCPRCLAWALDVTTCDVHNDFQRTQWKLPCLFYTLPRICVCVCVLCSAYYYNYPELKKKAKEWERVVTAGEKYKPRSHPKKDQKSSHTAPTPKELLWVTFGELLGCHWWRVAKSLTGKCWPSFVSNVYSGLRAAVVKSTKDFSEKSNQNSPCKSGCVCQCLHIICWNWHNAISWWWPMLERDPGLFIRDLQQSPWFVAPWLLSLSYFPCRGWRRPGCCCCCTPSANAPPFAHAHFVGGVGAQQHTVHASDALHRHCCLDLIAEYRINRWGDTRPVEK